MRLLNVDTLDLVKFRDEDRPPYVIASHRWVDGCEASLKDVQKRRNTDTTGYKKVLGFAQYVRENVPSVKWLWIDTCCINQQDAAELSEAVNRMFKWYRAAELCLAYLQDVTTVDDKAKFMNSEWYSRGWTLQELLSPRVVVFVTKSWEVIGNKGASFHGSRGIHTGPGLERDVSDITGIPEQILHNFEINSDVSVDDRLKWMEGRKTTREEDMFYALYGIFGVSPGANYGEEREGARQRLLGAMRQKESLHLPSDRKQAQLSPFSTVPFHRDPDFIERPASIEKLRTKLSIPGARAALVGLGGVGKTQLAVEYARRAREVSPRTWILWLFSGTAARFEQSVRNIAEQTKIQGRDDPKTNIFQLFYGWLCDKSNGPWLIILDNVDDASFLVTTSGSDIEGGGRLIDYLPACEHGLILITTRSKREAQRLVYASQIVEIAPMENADARALLEKKLGSEELEDYSQLAAALDFLPLAMAQAAAYIRERRPRCSVVQYLEQLEKGSKSRTTLLRREEQFPDRDREASSSILMTWQISFEYIFNTRRSATDLLSLMSFFDRQSIPEDLVRGETDETIFEEDITMLRSYSFILPTTDHASWEMHRLVQDATQMWLEDRKRLEEFQEYSLQRLSVAFPTGQYENWQVCQRLLSHALYAADRRPSDLDALLAWATIMYNAAWFMWMKGQLEQGERMAVSSMKAYSSSLGEDHELTIDSLGMVGNILLASGRWEEAEQIDQKVMEWRKAKLGPTHPDTITAMANLAVTYRNQGRWEEAEQINVSLLETLKTELGPDYPDSMMCVKLMVNLGVAYSMQGKEAQAEKIKLEAMEICKAKLGPDHPDTLSATHNLAVTYRKQKRWDAAEQHFLEVIKIRKTKLSADHPDTLTALVNLAETYGDQGRYDEAEQLAAEAIERRMTVLGPNHPHTQSAVLYLEDIQAARDRYTQPVDGIGRFLEGSDETRPIGLQSRNPQEDGTK